MTKNAWTDGDNVTATQLNRMEDQLVIICTSGTRPSGVEGQHVYETDTDRGYYFDGAGWRPTVGPRSSYTTITAATNFTTTLNLFRYGPYATMTVSVTRTTSNVAAGSATVGTVGTGGRGSFATFTQPLPMRSTGDSTLLNSLCWYNASTGVVTVDWPATWNTTVNMVFTGTVLLD